jgi:predicted permease
VLASWRSFWRTVWHRRRFEEDLSEELRFHLESRAEDLARTGVAPAEARRRARLELGAVEAHREEVRRARGVRLVDELVADLRFALRGWRRHRGLALAVIVILTIGIGISSALFTLVNAVLLRPPVRSDPASFAKVYVAHAVAPKLPHNFDPPELEDLLAFEGGSRSLEAVAGIRTVNGQLGTEHTYVRGAMVTCDYFRVHGPARPLLGRLLDRRDCNEGAAVMVMGEGLWRNLGADPALVGQALTYDRRPFTVVGVVAGKVDGELKRPDLFMPYTHGDLWPGSVRWERWFETDARLRPGHSRADAAAELNVLLGQLDGQHPGRRSQVRVTDGSEISRPTDKGTVGVLSLLFGLPVMILLLVCSNVVSLLLARAHARRHEIAVRLSLGAGRGRLMKMLAVETLPLAAVAGGLSLLLAHELPPLLVAYLAKRPKDIPLEPDWRVWIFVAGISLVAALASGLTPALEALKVELVESLKGRPAGGRDSQRRLRHLLVVGQIAVTVILLAGAGLFVRGYVTVSWDEMGFDRHHTLLAPLYVRDEDPRAWSSVHQAVSAELRVASGIEAVAFAEAPPPGGQYVQVARVDGAVEVHSRRVLLNGVSPEFFATLGLPILRGRTFLPGESATGQILPVIVSGALARKMWPDGDPLGSTLRGEDGRRFEVVGLTGDMLRPGKSDLPVLYRPLLPGPAVVVARFSGAPVAATATVESTVQKSAPGVFAAARTFQARYDEDALTLAKFASVILVVGGCALLVALVGVYGTVTFAVRRRTREMGIRVALGARGRDVVRALVAPTAKSVGTGLVIGMAGAYLMAPGLEPMTGELAFGDPLVYGAPALLLGAAALAAMLRPVLRALSLDQMGPASVLRDE